MEEFFYISHDLMEQDHNGHIVLSYELMMEVEHQFRIKWGGGIGCRHPSSSSGNAPPCSQEMLERALPGVSQTAKHWSAWYGQSMMDFCHQGPHRN